MAERQPEFSVVIPVYNHARFLPAALDSVLAQTVGDWEALIVNDGSTDETPAIAKRYAARDSRFVAIDKPNGGVASALNEGFARARGKWILWLSSDDMFLPEKLAIHRAWFERRPEARFFFGRFRLLFDEAGRYEDRELWGRVPPDGLAEVELLHRNYISGITICLDRAVAARIGRFDETLRYGQDYEYWTRVLGAAPACFVPERTAITRVHPGQGSETFPDACYFDSGLAAVRWLNSRDFAAALRSAAPQMALEHALTIAFDPTSFAYLLDHHAGVTLRLLEWIACVPPDAWADCPFERFADAAQAAAQRFPDTGFGLSARLLAQVARLRIPARYDQILPENLALRRWRRHHAARAPKAQTTLRWLEFHRQVAAPAAPARDGHLAVIATEAAAEAEARSFVRALAERGVRATLLGIGPHASLDSDGTLTIGAPTPEILARLRAVVAPAPEFVFESGDFDAMERALAAAATAAEPDALPGSPGYTLATSQIVGKTGASRAIWRRIYAALPERGRRLADRFGRR